LSTVPLGAKALCRTPDFEARAIAQLLACARELDALHDDTGRCIRLALEPEPLCVLETTDETLQFFSRLRAAADQQGLAAAVQRHLGVCFDVCHQAVEFEDVADSVRRLQRADIRINKLHITCAVHVESPGDPDVRRELSAFMEPRYLHQTVARTKSGIVLRRVDLEESLCSDPPAAFRDALAWRVHFHVPIHATDWGRLRSTQPELRAALSAVAQLDYAPHLEVETYTWQVLPGARPVDLVEGLQAELQAASGWIDALRRDPTSMAESPGGG
jgi:hypothetical protein